MNNWSPAHYRTISARYCFMVYIVTLSYASDKVVHVVKLYLTGYSLSSGLGAFMFKFRNQPVHHAENRDDSDFALHPIMVLSSFRIPVVILDISDVVERTTQSTARV